VVCGRFVGGAGQGRGATGRSRPLSAAQPPISDAQVQTVRFPRLSTNM
jgi:hypothetical protein